jgi:cation:H+ antiporter
VVPAFIASTVISLVASHRLVKALESLGARWAAPQVLLGLVAALAADGPELTSAVAAQLDGQHSIGVGVLFGSNVFNIAALLGVGAIVAGSVRFHRRAVLLEGTAALGVAAGSVLLVEGSLPVGVCAAVTAAFFVPYVVVVAVPSRRLPLPEAVRDWLATAVREEGEDLEGGYPASTLRSARREGLIAVSAVLVVVVASAVMEHSASVGGEALGAPAVVVGAVVLAAVTSLPNLVAAVYLAGAGKGAAMLSEAMNSNTLNVVGGLVLPAVLVGVGAGHLSAGGQLTVWAYAAMTVAALGLGLAGRGMSRTVGAVLAGAYVAFLAALLAL